MDNFNNAADFVDCIYIASMTIITRSGWQWWLVIRILEHPSAYNFSVKNRKTQMKRTFQKSSVIYKVVENSSQTFQLFL